MSSKFRDYTSPEGDAGLALRKEFSTLLYFVVNYQQNRQECQIRLVNALTEFGSAMKQDDYANQFLPPLMNTNGSVGFLALKTSREIGEMLRKRESLLFRCPPTNFELLDPIGSEKMLPGPACIRSRNISKYAADSWETLGKALKTMANDVDGCLGVLMNRYTSCRELLGGGSWLEQLDQLFLDLSQREETFAQWLKAYSINARKIALDVEQLVLQGEGNVDDDSGGGSLDAIGAGGGGGSGGPMMDPDTESQDSHHR